MAKPANTRSIKSAPAKSAVAQSVAKAMEKKATPGRKALTNEEKDSLKSNVVPLLGGTKASGMALAASHAEDAVKESASWREKFMAILALRGDPLAGYKTEMNTRKKTLAEQSKASNLQVSRYAGVHMSECLTVAKAAGKGCTGGAVLEIVNSKAVGKEKTVDTVAHAAIVTACREWNITHNVDGSKVTAVIEQARRGKAPMNPIEKAKRLILRTVSFKDLQGVATMMAAVAKRIKSQKDVEAELEAKPAEVSKKDDKRKAPRPMKAAA